VPHYILLMKYTDQGIKDIKNTAQRTQANIKALEAMGGKVNAIFACMGEYDLIGFGEAPNDEVATAMALMITSQGTVRTTTVKAFPMDQFAGVVKKLP
jgi:uncharacterized protein with GYD domain